MYNDEEFKIGDVKFAKGIGIVTQLFNPSKEIKLLEGVSARESLVQICKQQCQDSAGYKPFNPYKFLQALNALRFASITVVQEILEWRNGLIHPEPFIVSGENYLLKMIHDTEVFRVMPTLDLFGFEFGLRNPFIFPCGPRLAARKRLETKRKKMIEDKKMRAKSGNTNPNNEPDDMHTVSTSKREMILPRGDVEALVPDNEMATLLHDLSVVTEEHWILICQMESALREEEDRHTTKKSGPAQAGTGWGLERWTKMAWKFMHNFKANNNHHRSKRRGESGEGRELDGDNDNDNDNDNENGENEIGDDNGNDENHISITKTSRANRTDRTKKEIVVEVTKKKISKEQHTMMMAEELREENITMERAGRNAGIPKTSDFVSVLSDLKAGKKRTPKKEKEKEKEDGGHHHKKQHKIASPSYDNHNREARENDHNHNHSYNMDDGAGGSDALDLFGQSGNEDIPDNSSSSHHGSKNANSSSNSNRTPNKSPGGGKKAAKKIGKPGSSGYKPDDNRFKPDSRVTTATSSRGGTAKRRSGDDKVVGFTHGGAKPPEDIWDFDVSIEILAED
ncbi:hypothetical protein ScalyP_jg7385 [Parmales sp. scaly parma]|nr:hypothetical protein ScalyP_jg7385 [Parmales sp. scaly parma]